MDGTKNFFDLSKKEQVNLIEKNWDSEAIIEKRVMFEKIHWEDAEEIFFEKLNANGIAGVTFIPSTDFDFYQDENSSPYIDKEAYIDLRVLKDNKGFIFTIDVPNLDELRGDFSVEDLVDTCLAIYKTKNQDEEDINNLDEEDYENILKEMGEYLPTVREAISFLDKEINETLEDLSSLEKYGSFSEENAQLIIDDFILNEDEVEVTENDRLIINGTHSKMIIDEYYE